MNISDSSFIMGSGVGNSIRTNQKNAENVSDKGTATKLNTSANSDIVQVSEGQTFRGEVTSVTGDKVNILMDNNKTLVARMEESVNMNIGDKLTFAVKENNGANVVISPVMEGMSAAKDSAIFSILEANSFSPTEKNFAIAEKLLENNMSVDKASMQRIMQQSYKFPEASLDSIIGLNKLNIPVNEATINQYKDYMNNTHQLMNDISNLCDVVSDFQGKMTEELFSLNKNSDEILLINRELLETLSDVEDLQNVSDANLNDMSDVAMQEQQGAVNGDAAMQEQQGMVNGDAAMQEQQGMVNSDVAMQEQQGAVNGDAAFTEQPDMVGKEPEQLSDKNTDKLPEQDKGRPEKDLGLSRQELSTFADRLKSLGLGEKTVNDIINNSDSSMKLLNAAASELSKQQGLSADKLQEFFTSKEYKQLLTNGIKDKLTLNPEKMKNPDELNSLYKNIYEKANRLMDAFSESGGSAGEQMREQAKSVAERVDFINNLNNMYAYAQLPVKLNSSENNSELFVYMNKKNIKENKDQISALLHLDMDHLGPTDVHVSLHGGIVHTRFYVEDEESARIIDEHMSMLERAINESGFTHTNEVITREPTLERQPNEVVLNMFDSELEKSVKRYTFDVRR